MKNLTLLFVHIILLTCNSSTGQKKIKTQITQFQDNSKTNIYYFDINNILKKQNIYNTDNSENSIIEYSYTYKKFNSLTVKKGVDIEYNQLMLEDISAYEYLLSKGIKIRFPEVIFSEIRDISNILSIADEYNDYKINVKTNINEMVISFLGFNKNIRFNPSYLTRFIHENEIIKDYIYAIQKDTGLIYWEKFLLKEGTLKRTYFYSKDKSVIKVLYEFSSISNKILFEKKFDYKTSSAKSPTSWK